MCVSIRYTLTMTDTNPTKFPELNSVLQDLVDTAKDILGNNYIGAYLVGSFAIGDADIHSDCDFIIAIKNSLSEKQEAELRKLHDQIPLREGHWTKHLEGSYAMQNDLSTLSALEKKWLFIDHGHREMEWSSHCNSLEHRWSLRECGVVIEGPGPESFVAEVPPEVIRKKMQAAVQNFMPNLESWIKLDSISWAQRYAVTTLCRMMYSIETGRITSKKAALVWAKDRLDSEWTDLIQQALNGRSLGWDPTDLPSPELITATKAFAEYAKEWDPRNEKLLL